MIGIGIVLLFNQERQEIKDRRCYRRLRDLGVGYVIPGWKEDTHSNSLCDPILADEESLQG